MINPSNIVQPPGWATWATAIWSTPRTSWATIPFLARTRSFSVRICLFHLRHGRNEEDHSLQLEDKRQNRHIMTKQQGKIIILPRT
jgi:hypothetical protein